MGKKGTNSMSKKPRRQKQTAISRREFKSTVHEQPSQARTMEEHEAHLREAATQSAENSRDDIRRAIQGGDPVVIQSPPGCKDIWRQAFDKVYEEELGKMRQIVTETEFIVQQHYTATVNESAIDRHYDKPC